MEKEKCADCESELKEKEAFVLLVCKNCWDTRYYKKYSVPLNRLVMLFWAVINPIIWRLGRKSKWVRTNYKKIRKGKWLWGIMGAIKDYEPLETDEKYTSKDYENFQKFTEEIFKYESSK